MAKWSVDFDGTIEVEADSEEEARGCAWEKLINDGPQDHLTADVCPQTTTTKKKRGKKK